MAAERGPSRVWYWVGGGVAVLSVLVAVFWSVSAVLKYFDRIDNLQRVSVSGEEVVTFEDPGGYTLYYEAPGAAEGPLPPVTVSLVEVESGQPVPLNDYDGTFTYETGGHEGRAVLTFRIDEPGSYRLRAVTEGPGTGDIAVGRSLTRGIGRAIAGSVMLAFLGLAFAALVITVTAVKRHAR